MKTKMKTKINRLIIIIIIVFFIVVCFFCFRSIKTYSIAEYFPLNENDKYIFKYYEDNEEGIMTITVKDVKPVAEGKQFNFLFEGKYNNRIQTHILTSKGIVFYKNEHLEGDFPLRSIRVLSPPYILIPSELKKRIFILSNYLIYNLEGELIDKEKVEVDISFVGIEKIEVEAGGFKCIHFFARHNFKDISGKSKHMHTYDFWIAPEIGFIKAVHTFIPFIHYIRSEEKNIMNRYNGPFVEIFELKKAIIGGEIIGS